MSPRDRAEERRVRSPSMPAGLVMRVLDAADGAGTCDIVRGWPTGHVSADSSKDLDHEGVAATAVDRHHRDPRHPPPG